jgi:hypothetical protein
MFHVERVFFGGNRPRGWKLFHVEHFGVPWMHWQQIMFHVKPSCVTPLAILAKVALETYLFDGCWSVPRGTVMPTAPELLRVPNLVCPGYQFAVRVCMAADDRVSREDFRKSDLVRKQAGRHVPRGTKAGVAQDHFQRKKSSIIRSMGRRLGAFLCPRAGAVVVNWGLGWVRPSPRWESSGFQGGRELQSRE